jgi:hypothetical protein
MDWLHLTSEWVVGELSVIRATRIVGYEVYEFCHSETALLTKSISCRSILNVTSRCYASRRLF